MKCQTCRWVKIHDMYVCNDCGTERTVEEITGKTQEEWDKIKEDQKLSGWEPEYSKKQEG